MADAGSVSRSSQVGYEAGARVPDAAYLKNIAAAGADIHFVLFGERLSADRPRPFDWDLHDSVQETIEDWLSERGLSLPIKTRMKLLRFFLAHYELIERLDSDFIHEQMQKVA
jgi:transcriptional regulator with XRE-family HTH domain